MRTDIMELFVQASAKAGGLSEYELILAREMYPNTSHILDLVEDLQDTVEEAEERHAQQLSDLEEDHAELLRSAVSDIESAASSIHYALGELFDDVEEEPLELELVTQMNIDRAVELMREAYRLISRAQRDLE